MMKAESNSLITILVVDDTPGSIGVVQAVLEEAGYHVAIATSGEKALQRATLVMPHLILLDVLMPGLDGYETCRRLKAQEATRDIPVVFLSGLTETFDKVKGFALGAVDYLIKPIAPEELLARVLAHVTIGRLERELRAANRTLEERVAARTTELSATNARLREEIEERKRTEEALRESEQRFRTIFDQTFQLVGVLSVDGTVLRANPAALHFAGVSEETVLGKPFWETPWWAHSAEWREKLRAAVKEAAGGKLVRFEATHLTADGQLRDVDFSLEPVTDADGRVVQLIPEGRDITERKRTEETLRLSAERMEALLQLNQMTGETLDVIAGFAFDAAVRLTRSRLGYLAFLNEDQTVLTMQLWSPEAMAECKVPGLPRLYPVETTGLWGEAVRQRRAIITNDYAAANPWKKGLPEGHVRLTRHMNVPVMAGGRIVLVAGVGNKDEEYNDADVQQLTLLMEGLWRLIERKRAAEEIQRLNCDLDRRVKERTAELEAAIRELEAFSYSVSHDLRAPLRHIESFIGLLKPRASSLGGQSLHYMDTIAESAARLGRLIDALLAFSRLGRQEMSKASVDLGALVQEVLQELSPDAAGRSIRWTIGVLPPVIADRALLRTVLVNLIANAMKFTRPREVAEIEVGCERRGGESVIYVRDNGVGFDPSRLDELFGVFQRLHRSDEFEGTGVGLANVRRIIARHGGRTWAEGGVEKGATFYFSLP